MKTRMEHVNFQVSDPSAVANFLLCALPDFSIRYDSGVDDPERWLHVGNEDYYLALSLASEEDVRKRRKLYSPTVGLNHVGFEVSDLEKVRERLHDAGYQDVTQPNSHRYRSRLYFLGPEGYEWEFIEYFSEDSSLRNDYSDNMV